MYNNRRLLVIVVVVVVIATIAWILRPNRFYEGPVPEGADVSHYRETGETKYLNQCHIEEFYTVGEGSTAPYITGCSWENRQSTLVNWCTDHPKEPACKL